MEVKQCHSLAPSKATWKEGWIRQTGRKPRSCNKQSLSHLLAKRGKPKHWWRCAKNTHLRHSKHFTPSLLCIPTPCCPRHNSIIQTHTLSLSLLILHLHTSLSSSFSTLSYIHTYTHFDSVAPWKHTHTEYLLIFLLTLAHFSLSRTHSSSDFLSLAHSKSKLWPAGRLQPVCVWGGDKFLYSQRVPVRWSTHSAADRLEQRPLPARFCSHSSRLCLWSTSLPLNLNLKTRSLVVAAEQTSP